VQAWGDHVIGRLRPKAKALFQAGRFVGVEDDRARFGLPNEIHRARCEEVRGEIESALSDHFGRPVGLVLVVDAAVTAGGPATEGPSSPGGSPAPDRAAGGPAARSDTTVGAAPAPAPAPGPDPAPAPAPAPAPGPDADETEDLAAFDESELGEVAQVDNSAESRVRSAFPGAEEVS
jgi:DNA polymerase-3 subunit gamma/tau